MNKLFITLTLVGASFAANAVEKRYVTDQLWLQLRSGPSIENRIVKALPTGEHLIFIEEDAETGYSKVQTDKGVEGYVLTRYLEKEPVAKEKLILAQQELEKIKAELQATRTQRDQFKTDLDRIRNERSGLGRENTDLNKELDHIKSISASAIELDQKVRDLNEQTRELEVQNEALFTENTQLKDAGKQTYILYGGALVLAGIIAGLVLPSLRGRRSSSGWA